MEANYEAMWELVRPLVWAAHFDLHDLRKPACYQPNKSRRKLQHLRREVMWRLAEAGYRRMDIADFLFCRPRFVSENVRAWRAGIKQPAEQLEPPPPECPTS